MATSVDRFETVVGLECHVELSTRTKMFCGCRNEFGAPPNTNVCPTCLGHPGSLPVPNARAIELIARIGLALGCEIAPRSLFHRKNYFYPDMPKNYQISQYDLPVCVGGHLDIEVDGRTRRIGVTRVHMEEDTGKTTHAGASGRIADADYALVDYNRAGVPLVEIVSEPDLRSAAEAAAYLRELRSVLEALDVSDVRMEEGSLRCDANVSVRERGSDRLGVKVEIKNMNSVRSLERAVTYEAERQRAAILRGEQLVQETRHWSEDAGVTSSMRSKEEAFDYRYFPEPDVPPLEPDSAWVDRLREDLPTLPAQRRRAFAATYGLAPKVAATLAGSADLAELFEELFEKHPAVPPAAVAAWISSVLAYANESGRAIADIRRQAGIIGAVVELTSDGTISATAGKEVLREALDADRSPLEIVDERGLRQLSDASELGTVVDRVIEANPEPAAKARRGNEGVLGYLVGLVMKQTGGSANPQLARELLHERLSE
jgi:aspartyl-tRNA(Asn)/glutamyl-tRNA(Gln) amidotransferase subunit B